MPALIHKSDLQRIIREEYVRVMLENSGYKVTDARVRLIAEKMETGEIDEALSDFIDFAKGFGSFAGEKIGGAYEKAKAGVKAAGQDIAARADASKKQRAEKANPQAIQKTSNEISTEMSKIDDEWKTKQASNDQEWKQKQASLQQSAKDRLVKNGYVALSDEDLVSNSDQIYSDARQQLGKSGPRFLPAPKNTPAQRGEQRPFAPGAMGPVARAARG